MGAASALIAKISIDFLKINIIHQRQFALNQRHILEPDNMNHSLRTLLLSAIWLVIVI